MNSTVVDMCEVPGCCAPAQLRTNKENPKYRKSKWVREMYGVKNGFVCGTHHMNYLTKKNGLETVGELVKMINLKTATLNGFSTITEHKNSKHPSRKHRLDYCENIDGRLGFVCTTTPPPQELIDKYIESGYYEGWLDVDHIDGDPSNNNPDNLQTLCKCCHDFKGAMEKDYLSPGRKTLNLTSNGTFRTDESKIKSI